jgi:hypothetical protein
VGTRIQTKRRRLGLLAASVTAAFLFVGGASADDIGNNLDASVDAAAENMPLNVGGATGTTQLFVVPQGGDGKPGCNLTGSTTLVVSVASSDTTVATVSPSSVTFDSCGATATLTVTPVGAGSATISLTQTSNNTGATFNLAPATFIVDVTTPTPTNTAPSVSVAGVTGGASYPKGAVPAATCQVTDAEDGNSSFAASLGAFTGPYAADGIGTQTASCSYTDAGGLTASASETFSVIDPSAPSIDYALSPASPDGANGWYRGSVTLTWTVADPESSLATTGCVDQTISTDQASTEYSCSATSAGGTSGPVTVTIKRDGTPPDVLCGTADGLWHADDVEISCTASDALSLLLQSSDADFVLTTSVPDDTETDAASTDSREVSDVAGNVVVAGPVTGLKVDRKAPTVTAVCPATVLLGSTAAASWAATDGGSGVAAGRESGTVALDTSSVGTKTATVPAGASEDAVGNASAEATCSYAVIYRWAGFFQPVDNLPTQNTVKAGSAVPVKFSLGGYQGMGVLAAGYPTSNVAACDASASDDPLELTLTAGNSSLSYDATADQYVYVWKTDKSWAGQCRQLRVKLADGTVHAANFKLK